MSDNDNLNNPKTEEDLKDAFVERIINNPQVLDELKERLEQEDYIE